MLCFFPLLNFDYKNRFHVRLFGNYSDDVKISFEIMYVFYQSNLFKEISFSSF